MHIISDMTGDTLTILHTGISSWAEVGTLRQWQFLFCNPYSPHMYDHLFQYIPLPTSFQCQWVMTAHNYMTWHSVARTHIILSLTWSQCTSIWFLPFRSDGYKKLGNTWYLVLIWFTYPAVSKFLKVLTWVVIPHLLIFRACLKLSPHPQNFTFILSSNSPPHGDWPWS